MYNLITMLQQIQIIFSLPERSYTTAQWSKQCHSTTPTFVSKFGIIILDSILPIQHFKFVFLHTTLHTFCQASQHFRSHLTSLQVAAHSQPHRFPLQCMLWKRCLIFSWTTALISTPLSTINSFIMIPQQH